MDTSTARVKVEAVGNIFFDISDENFSITTGPWIQSITLTNGDVALTWHSSAGNKYRV